jgi:hypothetical protein
MSSEADIIAQYSLAFRACVPTSGWRDLSSRTVRMSSLSRGARAVSRGDLRSLRGRRRGSADERGSTTTCLSRLVRRGTYWVPSGACTPRDCPRIVGRPSASGLRTGLLRAGMRVAAREHMKRGLVSEALRRAALIPFTLVACGGAVAAPGSEGPGSPEAGGSSSSSGSGSSSGSSSGSGSGSSSGSSSGSGSGSSSGSSSGMGGGCALASQAPTAGGVCVTEYALASDISACNPGPNGALTSAQCVALCPAPIRLPWPLLVA